METEKSSIINKIGMIGFILFILIFVSLSGWIYSNNSTNVAIRIQTDDEVNKEKTAVNEALTKTLVSKNDSIQTFKVEVKKKDSINRTDLKVFKKELSKLNHEKDSLITIIRNLKQSDIQPIHRDQNN